MFRAMFEAEEDECRDDEDVCSFEVHPMHMPWDVPCAGPGL